MSAIGRDLRHAVRVMRKSPGFAVIAVLSLALGIGANTAVFSVIHAVLLRPLPYPAPERLVRVGQLVTQGAVSMPEFQFWKQHTAGFASAAGYRGSGDRSFVYGTRQEWVPTMLVTADFFRTLGAPPAIGREFDAAETQQGGPLAVVLSDALWRRACGADPEILGRTVRLDDAAYIVVGVLPAGFWFPQAADAFLALRPSRSLDDAGTNTHMIARLKPDLQLRQVQAEMPAIAESMRHTYRMSTEYRGLSVFPYQEWLVGDVRTTLLLVFGAVGLLLLIACSNLASLLLARLAARQKEIAIRLAMGSSRWGLLRQFLLENLLLTTAGGLAGLLGARAVLDVLVAAIPFSLPASAPVVLDGPVLVFTLAVAFATGTLFSLAPILGSARLDVQEMLKAGGRTAAGGARQRARSVLVVAEVALSVTLLVSAGLLIQSLYRMRQERLGFQPQGLVTFNTPIATNRRPTEAEFRRYQRTLLDRLRSVPGVRAVAAANVLPLAGYSNLPTQREGHIENSIGGMEVRAVTPEYFAVMHVPMRRGRGFLDTDTETAPPVILVNETVARRWWPGGNPVGDRVVIGRFRGKDFGTPVTREVVGVVGDTKTAYLKEPPSPTVFVPAAQNTYATNRVAWVMRANLTGGLASGIRSAIAEIDSTQRVLNMRTVEEVVAATTASSRFDAWLFGFLAGLALLLTAIGVYGLLAFSVARRTSEIGTRMALGASRGNVLAMVLKQGVGLIALGLVLGLAGALAATRSLTTLLFGVRATDPYTFAGVSAVLLLVGIAASYFPARRAMKVDPMTALRYE